MHKARIRTLEGSGGAFFVVELDGKQIQCDAVELELRGGEWGILRMTVPVCEAEAEVPGYTDISEIRTANPHGDT